MSEDARMIEAMDGLAETLKMVPLHFDDGAEILDESETGVPLIGSRDGQTAEPSSLKALYNVPVKVQAVLGRTRMPIGELMRLKAGAVVELDRRVGQPVDIFVNNRLIARGEVVLIENSLGVTLTEIVRQAE